MKILFLTNTDPKAVSYGGQQRTHSIWKGLCTAGNVWTVIPVPRKGLERDDEDNRIFCRCLEKRYSLGWIVQRMQAKFFPQISLSFGRDLSALDKFGVKFDVVVTRSLGIAARFCAWEIAPLVVDVDDTPTVVYALAHKHNMIVLCLLKLWQRHICKKANLLWVPDKEQMSDFKKFKVSCLPNVPRCGCEVANRSYSLHATVGGPVLLFIGYLAHTPNQDGINWFLKSYWNAIKEKFPNASFRIAGGGLPMEIRKVWGKYKDVEILGFVEDIESFYSSGNVFLAPMKTGSGTCIKVLEALAHGLPVVATPHGFRGIPHKDRTPCNSMYEFSDINSLVFALTSVAPPPPTHTWPLKQNTWNLWQRGTAKRRSALYPRTLFANDHRLNYPERSPELYVGAKFASPLALLLGGEAC